MLSMILFGDSIIDNAPYLQRGEPDVAAKVSAALGNDCNVERRAVDGATIQDIQARQISPKSNADAIVLSVGGNNLLQLRQQLLTDEVQPMAAALEKLYHVRSAFAETYGEVLDTLLEIGAPMLAFTIYNPRFETKEGYPSEYQRVAEAAVAFFNDAIQMEARRRRIDILELRLIATGDSDFANAIEPSTTGGEKFARAIAAWASNL